ncbi:MAG: hypothetical protein MJB14_10660 [Spirochaetes bacterium]|nr:hypothetical protein [Spirochaetota bacterium]
MNMFKCPKCGGDLVFIIDSEFEYFTCIICDFSCDHNNLIPDLKISNLEIEVDNIDVELLIKIVNFKNKMLKNEMNF